MEQQESTPKTTKPFVEIEAPERLVVGQNFYDQEPFNKIIGEITEQTKQEAENVRWLTTSIAKHFSETSSEKLERMSQHINYNKSLDELARQTQQRFGGREKTRELITQVIGALLEYPLWTKYIATQLSPTNHQYDGKFCATRKRTPEDLPRSYVSWANLNLTTQQRAVLLGMDEIFPEDFGLETDTVPRTGEKPPTRKWRILKAAGLVRKKR